MNRDNLIAQIRKKKSFLCVGLDTDESKLPNHLKGEKNGVLEFNKAIIDATRDLCVAYKPNLAFYEVMGSKGWDVLQETLNYIGGEHLVIADAKRGDIGNSSNYYAKTFFENMNFGAVTVSPYMGYDSVKPFLNYKDKWAIVLGLTSNTGAEDIQTKELNALLSIGSEGIQNRQRWMQLYEHVAYELKDWGTNENTMLVVGATRPDRIEKIRNILPSHFLLIPGVGAQGGDLDMVMKNGLNSDIGLLINSSRGIIYASPEKDFATKAREKAIEIRVLMEKALKDNKLL